MGNSIQKGYTRGALIATTFQLLCSGSEKRQRFGSTFDRYKKNWIFAHPPVSHVSDEIMVWIRCGVFLFLLLRCPMELDSRETMIARIRTHAVESFHQ